MLGQQEGQVVRRGAGGSCSSDGQTVGPCVGIKGCWGGLQDGGGGGGGSSSREEAGDGA